MNNKQKDKLIYSVLFTGLGVFSYLLLYNFTPIPERVPDEISSVAICLFFMLAFNFLGFSTIHITSWINRQYTINIRKKWRIAMIYIGMMLMFLLLNYGLLVVGKLLLKDPYIFTFPKGGLKILLLVWLIELVVVGLALANRSMKRSLVLQTQTAELQKENTNAQYKALQQQLNPHFLFNSLNTLIAEIEYSPKNAVTFTQKLSDVYRYVLQSQNKTMVTLNDELEFLNAYLFLHKVRLGDCIVCNLNIAEELKDCVLPPLTLQLLIENVIKHNSISQNRPMNIKISATHGELIVSNPMIPKKNSSISGVGLSNLSKRCKLMIGKDIQISNENNLFTVKVPLS